MKIAVQRPSRQSGLPTVKQLRDWARLALEDADPQCELSLRVVDEAEMSELNRAYRGKRGPTNVLSFPAEMPPGLPLPLLGDIVICAPVVTHEAAEQGKSEMAHWAHMVIHGCLHLLGHDHLKDTEAVRMENLEIALLARLGYPNPYQQ